MHYPNFIGKNSTKLAMFRENTQLPLSNPGRFPLGTTFPFHVDVPFGFTVRNQRRANAMQLNPLQAIKTSADKVKTKQIWKEHAMRHHIQKYVTLLAVTSVEDGEMYFQLDLFEAAFGASFKILAKPRNLSGGRGIHEINNVSGLTAFLQNEFPQLEGSLDSRREQYYFEEFFEFDQEFRIHVSPWLLHKGINYQYEYSVPLRGEDQFRTEQSPLATRRNGVILGQRKMIRQEAYTAGHRQRSLSEATYFTTRFDAPRQWADMCNSAVTAIALLGLDFGFVDCLYNSRTGEYVFTESGSNPGMADVNPNKPTMNVTAQHYLQALPAIIFFKAQNSTQYSPLLTRDESYFTAQAEQLNAVTATTHSVSAAPQTHFTRRSTKVKLK